MAKKKSPSILAREKLAKEKRIRKNYARLKKAGFSPYDASSMRYGSKEKIRTAIKTKTRPTISQKHQEAGGGSGKRYSHLDTYQKAVPLDSRHIGAIKKSDYQLITDTSPTKYLLKYTYKMTYITVDKDGVETRKFIIQVGDKIQTKRQLKDWAWKILDRENEDKEGSIYHAKPIKSSIEFVSAYINNHEELS